MEILKIAKDQALIWKQHRAPAVAPYHTQPGLTRYLVISLHPGFMAAQERVKPARETRENQQLNKIRLGENLCAVNKRCSRLASEQNTRSRTQSVGEACVCFFFFNSFVQRIFTEHQLWG